MDNMNLNKHISGQFNAEAESVRNRGTGDGGWWRSNSPTPSPPSMARIWMRARKSWPTTTKVNAMEVAIDEECTRIIAKASAHRVRPAGLVMAIIKHHTGSGAIGDVADKTPAC